MRLALVLLAALAACAPAAPPASPVPVAAPEPPQISPQERYTERALRETRQAGLASGAENARMAAEAIIAETPGAPPAPARRPRTPAERAAASAWEAAVRREQRQIHASILETLAHERRAAGMVGQSAREERYCTSLAHDLGQAGMSAGELTASLLLGTSYQERAVYRDCMSSFRRMRNYLE